MAILLFYIVPSAKIDKVIGEHGGAIKIKVRAPAVGGKANEALRNFLAERLRISARSIVLEHGKKWREKRIRIEGLNAEEIVRHLLPII